MHPLQGRAAVPSRRKYGAWEHASSRCGRAGRAPLPGEVVAETDQSQEHCGRAGRTTLPGEVVAETQRRGHYNYPPRKFDDFCSFCAGAHHADGTTGKAARAERRNATAEERLPFRFPVAKICLSNRDIVKNHTTISRRCQAGFRKIEGSRALPRKAPAKRPCRFTV